MNPGRAALAESVEQRTRETHDRADQALRAMNAEGAQISFAAVAKRAGVSRGFLYANGRLRKQIESLRTATASGGSVPATERVSRESLRARLRAALDDNSRLRGEIAAIREELALAHGRVRELQTAARSGRAAQ